MMKFGKALVFANLFVGVGLAAWALSLYANRVDYFDRDGTTPVVEGRFTQLKKEVDDLAAAASAAQKGYAAKADEVQKYETNRDNRLGQLATRLDAVRKADDANVVFRQQLVVKDARFPALIDLATEGPPVNGVRNVQLRGLGFLKSEMAKSVKEEATTTVAIYADRKKLRDLNSQAQAVQDEVFAQKLIRVNLIDQRAFLGDSQVNWDERLRVLEIRKTQMTERLQSLGADAKLSRADGGN